MRARLSLLVDVPPYDDPVAAIAGLRSCDVELVVATEDPRLDRWPDVVTVAPGPGSLGRALVKATAPAVAVADSGGVIDPTVLGTVLAAVRNDEGSAVVYSDERVAGADVRKPEWSPALLGHFNYLGRLTVLPRALALAAGGLPPGSAPDVLHRLLLRLARAGAPFRHVPEIAYERMRPDMLSLLPYGPAEPVDATVSILLPTAGARARDGRSPEVLAGRALASVSRAAGDMDVEVVVVAGPEAEEAAISELGEHALVRLVRDRESFNFSRRINLAAAASRGQVLVWLNDDVERHNDDRWLAALVDLALEDDVGAVGAKLLYPDARVQTVGVRFRGGLPTHVGVGAAPEAAGPLRVFIAPREQSAITGAVLATRAEVFDEVGGVTDALPINFGDTDYCLKVRSRGYRVVLTPAATLRHRESASRNPIVHTGECDALVERWPEFKDPYWPWPEKADTHPPLEVDRRRQ